MENIQYKLKTNRNIKRFLYSYVTIFLIFFLSFFIILESFRFVQKRMKINESKEILKTELSRIQDSIDNKKKEIEKLNTEEGQELYFRENLPVGKKEEKVIILYNKIESPVTEMATHTDSLWKDFTKRVNYFIDNYTNL